MKDLDSSSWPIMPRLEVWNGSMRVSEVACHPDILESELFAEHVLIRAIEVHGEAAAVASGFAPAYEPPIEATLIQFPNRISDA